MEVNDFRIALFDGDEDEEFMSCDEGDEEDIPTFSATFEDIFGTVRAGHVVGAVQREQSQCEKDTMVNIGNNVTALLNTSHPKDAMLTRPPQDEVREISIGSSCLSNDDTQVSANWGMMRPASHTYDRTSKCTNGGQLWSLDEEEEDAEEDSDDDYEFFDSRSSSSRIQSIDEGHISTREALQKQDKKRSPDRECHGQFLRFQISEEKIKDSYVAEVDHIDNLDDNKNEHVNSHITEVDHAKSSNVEDEATNSDTSDHVMKSDITEVYCIKNVLTAEIGHVNSDTIEVAHVKNSNIEDGETNNSDIIKIDRVKNSVTTEVNLVNSDITQVAHVKNSATDDDQPKKSVVAEVDCVKNSVIADIDYVSTSNITKIGPQIVESGHVNSDATEIICVKNEDVKDDQAKNSGVDHVIQGVSHLKHAHIEDDQAKSSVVIEFDHVETSDGAKKDDIINLNLKDIWQAKESDETEVDTVINFKENNDSVKLYSTEVQKDHYILSATKSEIEYQTLQSDLTASAEIPVCPVADVLQTYVLSSEPLDMQLITRELEYTPSTSFVSALAKPEVTEPHTAFLPASMDSVTASGISNYSECPQPETGVRAVLSAEQAIEVPGDPPAHKNSGTENTRQLSDHPQASLLQACSESPLAAAERPADVILSDVTEVHAGHLQASSSVAVTDKQLDCLGIVSVKSEAVSSEPLSMARTMGPGVALEKSEVDLRSPNIVRTSLITNLQISATGLTNKEDNFPQAVTDFQPSDSSLLNTEEQTFLNCSALSPSSSLNQLSETLQEISHATGSSLNQLHETLQEVPQVTGSSLNQLSETLQEVPRVTGSSLNQLHETLQEVPWVTGSSLNQLSETLPEVAQATGSSLNRLSETLQEVPQITGSSLNQLSETLPEVAQATGSSLNQLSETLKEVPRVTGSSLNQLSETLQEVPQATGSSLNQPTETLQEVAQATGSPEPEHISCSHMLKTCSYASLEEPALQSINSLSPVSDAMTKVYEGKTRNDIQHEQPADKMPQEELTCDTAANGNVVASVNVHGNTVQVASELLPDTALRQFSTLTNRILPPGLPQNQQAHALLPSTNLTSHVDSEHRNTNTTARLPSDFYGGNLNADNEEDNVSEDSLGEECGDIGSIDPGSGDAASTASSDTHLCDSLDEDSEENVLDAGKNVLTRLEEKPKEIDVHKAKLRASLSWLLSKVYGSSIPKELQDPFYETAEGQLILRPVLVNLLSSSELYCQACSNLFPETHTQWQGHWSIIQLLSRKGIYISEVQESAVTETVLVQTAPFRLKAHLALIDALMKAYIYEVASVERVVQAVRRITTFPASSELPANPEEALVFWVNKVCTVLGIEGVSKGKAEEVSDGAGGQTVRVVKASPYPEPVQVPLLEDLMRDIGDGCSLAAVIAYYKPQLLCIKDLYLKEGIGTADALHNLQQIGNFCQSYFPCRCFHLSYEDLLYTHNVMKVNILAFLADLFHGLEGPDSCQGQGAHPAAGKKSSQTVHGAVPISQATKRSFHRPGLEETASNLGMGRSAVTSPIFQPLLSKRISGRHCIPQEEGGMSLSASSTKRSSSRRALSLSTTQDRELINKSLLAWQDDQRLQHRSSADGAASNPYTRLSANASLESAVNRNRNSNSNLGLDFINLESPCQDYMELDSLTLNHPHLTHPHQQADRLSNRTPTAAVTDQKLEPLMPALLRPAKEKQISLSKAEESGDRSPRRRKVMPSADQTPVASLVQRSTALSPVSPGGRSQSPYQKSQPQGSRGKAFEAFVVGPGSEANAASEAKSKQGISGNTSQSALQRAADISPAGSYTVQDRAKTVQAARAAGIPVVSDSEDTLLTAGRSREGSIASSGEYSDHESQKIHQEYKVRESGIVTPRDAKITEANISNNGSSKPVMLISDHLSGDPTNLDGDDHGVSNKLSSKTTTNFAELKRLKDKLGYNLDRVDRSALIYMQSGSHGGPYDKMSGIDLKSSFVNKQGQNQPQSNGDSNKTGGTEQNPQMSRSADMTDNAALEASETNPGSLELQQLRLKLEQKRKDIERKKHRQEAQHTKMRQQLGKAAFMRVVSKHADGTVEGESSDQADTARLDQSASQIQLQARLGQLHQKSPAGGSPGHQLPAHHNTLHTALGQNSVIPADVSAQRFTDWRTMSRGGGGGGMSASPIGDNQFGSKDQAQLLQARAGALGGSSNMGSAYSSGTPETSRNKAFSRAGMQQTIDNVRNKWFKSDSDLISSGRAGSGEEDADGDSFRLHGDDILAGARAGTMQEPIHKPPSLQSQSPFQGTPHSAPTQYAGTQVSASTRDTGSPPMSDLEYQVYDSSLHKLNSSLTELQGEIMRLSLQHEQFKAAQSPVSGLSPRISDGSVVGISPSQSRPIHGIPQQVPFTQGAVARTNGPSSSSHKQLPPLAQATDVATPPVNSDSFIPGVSDISPQTRPAYETEPSLSEPRQETSDTEDVMNISNDGFFVSFGEKTTPKRHKPKLAEHRARGVSPAPNAGLAAAAQTPLTVMGSSGGISDEVAANLANQAIVATVNIHKDGDLSDESSSPSIGFVIKDESPATKEAVGDDEMHKKRIKLMEMQRKRKDDLEKKRLEKEAETARKLEEKLIKEEEQERKKAEEKARRELIFQQYLQKKQEEDESPAKPTPKKRDASASKQRPKSMFVKKAMTPEPGALAPDSGSSSQEDLTGRGTLSGRSTPSVMSALRSAFHFRLPEPSKIRKAVSCNTLQGATNGATGPSTYRRPPSPDLNKARQQRQRGSSQESGSETGSGSNPGSDYAGPKLFVKPSAKSNRHIIINAISHCCLAGSVNTDMKNKVLEELQKCDANHFLILFRDAGCQYRGLFIFYPETEEAFKVLGVGPKHIVNAMCEKFYKYNSGAKSFSEITSTKHLSVSVDAVVLHTAVWKSGKAVIKR